MDILKGLGKEFGWLWLALLGLGIVWYFSGGAQDPDAHRAYIKPPAPLDTGETYGKYYEGGDPNRPESLDLPEAPAVLVRNVESKIEDFFTESQKARDIHKNSLLAKKIYFDGIAGAKAEKVKDEFLRILASNEAKNPIIISGLTITGLGYGVNTIIPKAAQLPVLGATVTRGDVYLPPGGRALISSGRSPIGTSFQVNMCTGYLDQFQDYTPDLRKECPSPSTELKKAGLDKDQICAAFVEKLPRCRIYQGNFPSTISATCKKFVTEKLTYNGCVASNKKYEEFYEKEWRIFLGQDEELWREKNEVVRLIDAKGGIIDAITY
jgi:hypothetical protein